MKFEYSSEFTPAALILPVKLCRLDSSVQVECAVKIDTGADWTVIPESIIDDLALIQKGVINAQGAFDTSERQLPTYHIRLIIEDNLSFDLEVVSYARGHGLIGRDALNKIILHADGPAGLFEISGGIIS